MIDAEGLFARVASGDWPGALDLAGVAAGGPGDDPLAARAVDLLVSAIDGLLDRGSLSDTDIERYLVLGRAGRIPLGPAREGRAVEALLHRYRGKPERALAIARFRPDLPAAAAVIGQYGRPAVTELPDADHRVSAAEASPLSRDAGRPLFRSDLERAFHAAACRVFTDALVQCNVALHAALDVDLIRRRLTAAELRHVFNGLVDCVVFDPARGFRPIRFYELDGPVHDDAVRRERDRLKDRILSVAGHRLVRIRPRGDTAESGSPEALERLLRGIEAGDAAYIAGTDSIPDP